MTDIWVNRDAFFPILHLVTPFIVYQIMAASDELRTKEFESLTSASRTLYATRSCYTLLFRAIISALIIQISLISKSLLKVAGAFIVPNIRYPFKKCQPIGLVLE